jgi:hypothetical protein
MSVPGSALGRLARLGGDLTAILRPTAGARAGRLPSGPTSRYGKRLVTIGYRGNGARAGCVYARLLIYLASERALSLGLRRHKTDDLKD